MINIRPTPASLCPQTRIGVLSTLMCAHIYIYIYICLGTLVYVYPFVLYVFTYRYVYIYIYIYIDVYIADLPNSSKLSSCQSYRMSYESSKDVLCTGCSKLASSTREFFVWHIDVNIPRHTLVNLWYITRYDASFHRLVNTQVSAVSVLVRFDQRFGGCDHVTSSLSMLSLSFFLSIIIHDVLFILYTYTDLFCKESSAIASSERWESANCWFLSRCWTYLWDLVREICFNWRLLSVVRSVRP